MSVLLALGIVTILILIGFLWGSIDVKKYKRDYKFESTDFINRFENDAWTLRWHHDDWLVQKNHEFLEKLIF